MAPEPAVTAAYMDLPFQEAIEFLRGKLNLPTQGWRDLRREAHDTAFVVASVVKMDLLAELREAVDRALAAGESLQAFQKRFEEICQRRGWSPWGGTAWRAETILLTNLRTAYAAGRWRQLLEPESLRARPYLIYRHGASRVPRPLHLAWNGLILAADDPWWLTHAPPNGFGCKCRVFAVSRSELKALGRSGPDPAPDDGTWEWTDPKTGKVEVLPAGIDPGWDYAPGASLLSEGAARVAKQKVAAVAPELAAAAKLEQELIAARVTSRAAAKELGRKVLTEIFASNVELPGGDKVTLREAFERTKYYSPEAASAARQFQGELLRLLEKTRSISTPVARVVGDAEGRAVIERASTRFPDEWTSKSDELGELHVTYTTTERGSAWTAPDGDGYIVTNSTSTAEHEFAHRLQAALPGLDALFLEEHQARTSGDQLEKLVDVMKGWRFDVDEVTRKDKYYHAYQGKVRPDGRTPEVMTMAFQPLLGPVDDTDEQNRHRLWDLFRIDQEMADLAVGLLFGWRP